MYISAKMCAYIYTYMACVYSSMFKAEPSWASSGFMQVHKVMFSNSGLNLNPTLTLKNLPL